MPKYINVDEIDYKIICYPHLDLYTRTVSTEELDGVYALKTDIDSMPPADVREVKHGHWVLDDETDGWRCSECGHSTNERVLKWYQNINENICNMCYQSTKPCRGVTTLTYRRL